MALAAAGTRRHVPAWDSRLLSRSQEPTRVVDRGHLDSTGGQGGLGLEPIPFKRRYRSEEVVLVPSVLVGQRGELHQ